MANARLASTPIGPPSEQLDLLERFDRAWRDATTPRIDDFLPPCDGGAGEGASRREGLEDLIKIDLEFRWRHAGHEVDRPPSPGPDRDNPRPDPDPLPARPLVEDYLAHFPELGPPGRVAPALISEEYRVRWRWGDCPGRAEYLARFPAQAAALGSMLAAIDDELEADGEGTVLAEAPSTDPGETARPPFERVGRYELGEFLGMGSFGSVWRARDPELGRDVAIKVPRGGSLGSPASEQRFLREARSVASLRHPGIVAVHDTGRDGQTVFIVSELVRGESLARRLDRGPMDSRAAATLGARVADALDYAHRQGVVHRDLKPSNILLESDAGAGTAAAPGPPGPRPRIVDFGLARLQAAEATMTVEGQLLGTPAYMSPEQLRSPHAVDGRSDVYSLGVVIYQMLTGELPFRGVSPMLQVQVLEDEPSPPRRLDDRIPRDLETIALKCLAKEPARRYPTAGDLADDLRRFLAGESIRARPAGQVERFYRRCRRYPIVTGLAATLVLAILSGIGGVTWQWLRAEANLRRAEINLAQAHLVVDKMYTDLASKLGRRSGTEDDQRELLEKAVDFYVNVALPQARDPMMRLAVGHSIGRMGVFQQKLGELDKAEASYRRARDILGTLAADYPGDSRFRHDLAVVHGFLADLYGETHQWATAEQAHKDGLVIGERLAAEQPDEPGTLRDLAKGYNNVANFYQMTGRFDEAVANHRKNVAIFTRLAMRDPTVLEDRISLARGSLSLGEAHRSARQPAEAGAAYRRAMEVYEALAAESPAVLLNHQHDLALLHANLGHLYLQSGRTTDAVAAYRRAAEVYEALHAEDSKVILIRRELAAIYYNLGTTCHLAGRRIEAGQPYRRAMALQEKLVVEHPDMPADRFGLAKTAINLGILLSETGYPSQAMPMLERAEQLLERLIRDHPEVVEYREALPEGLGVLAKLHRESGRKEEALRTYRRRRDVLLKLPFINADGLYNLAGIEAQCTAIGGTAVEPGTAAGPRFTLDRAMDALRQAVAADFQDLDRLRHDSNLDPIRSRREFQAIALELMDRRFPPDPLSR